LPIYSKINLCNANAVNVINGTEGDANKLYASQAGLPGVRKWTWTPLGDFLQTPMHVR